jgi:hypothetical protein
MFQNVRYVLLLVMVAVSTASAQSANSILGGMTGILQGINQTQSQSQYEDQGLQAALARQRANTDPRLAPLSPSGGLSQRSQQAIWSTLNSLLETSTGNSQKRWVSDEYNTRTTGSVTVYNVEVSQFGLPCRKFRLDIVFPNGVTGDVDGSACREQGGWRWLSGMR